MRKIWLSLKAREVLALCCMASWAVEQVVWGARAAPILGGLQAPRGQSAESVPSADPALSRSRDLPRCLSDSVELMLHLSRSLRAIPFL